MSLLEKAKAIKKKNVAIKGTVMLSDKDAEAFSKLSEKIGAKELITIALSEPKGLKRALKKNKKVACPVNMKVELSALEAEELNALFKEGFTMDEILNAALARVNLIKSLKEIEAIEDVV